MKKVYCNIEIEMMLFPKEDIVRTSNLDNVEDLPDFPEDFED